MENDVNIIPPIQLESTPVQPKPKIWWIILLIILGVVIAGYFVSAKYFLYLWPFGTETQPIPSSTPRPSPSVNSGQSEVPADWKTFQHKIDGFEFRYPSDWTVEDDGFFFLINSPQTGKTQSTCDNKCTANIFLIRDFNYSSLSPQEYFDGNYYIGSGKSDSGIVAFDNPGKDSEIIVAGNTAYKSYPKSGDPKVQVIIPVHDRFIVFQTSGHEDILDKMVSTFKLIETDYDRVAYRDRKRYTDVLGWNPALNLYFIDHGVYPTSLEELRSSNAELHYLNLIAPVPADGSCSETENKFTYYQLDGGKNYNLSFCLGKRFDSKTAGLNYGPNLEPGKHVADPNGIK